jgi:uncharacterized protein YcfL
MKYAFKILLLSLLLVLINSCGSSYRAASLDRPQLVDTDKVVFQNMRLKAIVGVVDINDDYVNGFLRSSLRLKNMTSRTVNIELMIYFKDRNGFETSEIGWDPLQLQPGEVTTIRRISNSTEANDYHYVIKLASR